MSDDSGEILEAYVKFKADDAGLVSTIEAGRAKIGTIAPAADKARDSVGRFVKGGRDGMNGVVKDADRAAAQFKSVGSEIDKASDKHKSWQKNLKGEAGRRSELGETLEILRGAGAVAGIAIGAEVLKAVSAKAVDFSRASQRGEGNAALAVRFGEMLPIVGAVVEAGQNFREMATGQQAFIDATKNAAEWMTRFSEEAILAERDLHQQHIASVDRSRDFRQDAVYKNVTGGKNQERAAEEIDYGRRDRSAAETMNLALQAITAKASAVLQKNEDEVRASFAKTKDTNWERIKQANPFANHDQINQQYENELREEIERRNGSVKSQAKADSAQVVADYKAEKAAIDDAHQANVKRIEGIKKEAFEIESRTSLIGLTPLESARKQYENEGRSLDAVNGLMEVKSKEIIATMHQELLLPYEKYWQELKGIAQLEASGMNGIDSQRARLRAVERFQGGLSVEEIWRSNMAIYMGRRAVGDPANRNEQGFHNAPADDNTEATMDNTTALQNLNTTLASGNLAVFQ